VRIHARVDKRIQRGPTPSGIVSLKKLLLALLDGLPMSI
jgi:hypothetical protein